MPRVRLDVISAVVLLAGVLVGCGDEASGGAPLPGAPYASPGLRNDPDVTAVADRLDPMLRRDFAASYSGLVLEHDARTVVVYRRPDRALDARVRGEVTAITIELRDARVSLREMEALTERVVADMPYWSQQGMRSTTSDPRLTGPASRW